MASIKVGSARIDENGNASGGAAGDQTGKEVMMQAMYTHSKGWYIFRAKKVAYAKKLASLMKKACNNNNIGYDQGNRLGIIKYGISTTTKTECDCSSLVRQCIIEATGKDPGNFTTATEASMLAATGLFESKIAYVSQAKTPVYNGDILVTKTKGHTVIVVSGNPRSSSSSSSTSSAPSYTVGKTYTLQKELVVRKTASTSGTKVGYSGLTVDGKKHDSDKDGALDKGTVVTCKGITKKSNGNIWMKIPSGYVLAYNKSSKAINIK